MSLRIALAMALILAVAAFAVSARAQGGADQGDDLRVLVNAHRAENGVQTLLRDPRLEASAQRKAEDLRDRDYFAHNTPEGMSVSEQMCEWGGYCWNSYRGENLAGGFNTAEDAFNALRESPGHNYNMLFDGYRVTGTGYAEGGYYGKYYAQQFGSVDSCDLRLDGARNIGDILTFRPQLGGTDWRWDFDLDGDVDMADVLAWKGCVE